MGNEHENIHFETSSVLIRQYPISMVEKPNGWSYAQVDAFKNETLKNSMIQIDAAVVRLGKKSDFPSFGWDNEYGSLELK